MYCVLHTGTTCACGSDIAESTVRSDDPDAPFWLAHGEKKRMQSDDLEM